VTPEDELAKAVDGHDHWRLDGRAALYEPQGADGRVRVVPYASPTRSNRWHATLQLHGKAKQATPCGAAADAIRWAERVLPAR
jgi:hypothetical protein